MKSKHNDLSDRQLVTRLANCSDAEKQEILLQLYERYKLLVLKVCYRYASDYDMAADLMHEVFVKVIENAGNIKNPAIFKSWLMTITRNLCVDYLRKTSLLKNQESLTPEIEITCSKYTEDTIIASLGREAVLKQLQGCINHLDAFDQNVLRLRWQGLRAARIQAIVKTDKAQLRRSYDKIKKVLESCMESKGFEISIEQILILGELDE
jgi:RNA polymerase sigma-70 factor (ECF subfamily)